MLPLALAQIGCLTGFILLLLTAAWQDWRTMHIADGISAGIVAAFGLWAGAGLADGVLSLTDLGLAVACATGVSAVGALAFAAGVMGGGDVKLAAASSLFAGPALMVDFAMATALAGALLGIAILAGAPIGPASSAGDGTIGARLRRELPYGPAIATGGLWVAAALAGTR